MFNYFLPLIIFVAVVFIFQYLQKASSKEDAQTQHKYKNRKYLMTKAEHTFYKQLLEKYPSDKYWIFSKVRLADLVEPVGVGKERLYAFNKIKAKHIDFVITDHQSKIIKAIELDDYTHNSEKRQKRDVFVNNVLESSGIEIVRV